MEDDDELDRLLAEFGLTGGEDEAADDDRLIDWGWDE